MQRQEGMDRILKAAFVNNKGIQSICKNATISLEIVLGRLEWYLVDRPPD